MAKNSAKQPRIHVDLDVEIDKAVAQSKAGLTLVRITKEKSFMEGPHPNGIDPGYRITGYEIRKPEIGQRYNVRRSNSMHVFSTSPVVTIIDEFHFETHNGLYEIEYVDDIER